MTTTSKGDLSSNHRVSLDEILGWHTDITYMLMAATGPAGGKQLQLHLNLLTKELHYSVRLRNPGDYRFGSVTTYSDLETALQAYNEAPGP